MLGKNHKRILELLTTMSGCDTGFAWRVDAIGDMLGLAQPSVQRSLTSLLHKGLLVRNKQIYTPWGGGLNRWFYEYLRSDFQEEHQKYLTNREVEANLELEKLKIEFESSGSKLDFETWRFGRSFNKN